MKAKILNAMDVYLQSNPLFVEGGQNVNFHLRFRAKLQGGKNDFRQRHNVIFTQSLVGLLVKPVDFSNLYCIMCQK